MLRFALDLALIVAAVVLLGIGVFTYPDVPPFVWLTALPVGLALVLPRPAGSSSPAARVFESTHR